MSKGKRNLGQGKFHYFDYETFCGDFKDTKWCSPEFKEVLDPAFESGNVLIFRDGISGEDRLYLYPDDFYYGKDGSGYNDQGRIPYEFRSDDKVDKTSFYKKLTSVLKGDSDPSILVVKPAYSVNELYPVGSSLLVFDMYSDHFLHKVVDLSEEDMYEIQAAFDPYTSYDGASDAEYAEETIEDGEFFSYDLGNKFNQDVQDILKQIYSFLDPDWETTQERKDLVSNLLGDLFYLVFDSQKSDIAYEYNHYYNQMIATGIREEVNKDGRQFFGKFGFVPNFSRGELYIKLSQLYYQMRLHKAEHKTLLNFMTDLFENENNRTFGGYSEDRYNYGTWDNFDKDGFSRDIMPNLEKVLEYLTENVSDKKLQVFKKILEKFKVKYWFVDSETSLEYQINSYDFEKGSIKLRVMKPNSWGSEYVEMPLMQFAEFSKRLGPKHPPKFR